MLLLKNTCFQWILLVSFIFFLGFPLQTNSQTIKLSIGGSAQFHLKGKKNENNNIPAEYRQSIEAPSIAQFFNNDTPIAFSTSIELPLPLEQRLFFEFSYEQSNLHNSNTGSENILGQSLKCQTYFFSGGLGNALNDYGTTILWGSLGLGQKIYEGMSSVSGFQLIHNYKTTTMLRISGGLEFEELLDSPLSLSLGVAFDFGKVERDEVGVYYENVKVARLIPEGDKVLQDNIFSFHISLKYSIHLCLL